MDCIDVLSDTAASFEMIDSSNEQVFASEKKNCINDGPLKEHTAIEEENNINDNPFKEQASNEKENNLNDNPFKEKAASEKENDDMSVNCDKTLKDKFYENVNSISGDNLLDATILDNSDILNINNHPTELIRYTKSLEESTIKESVSELIEVPFASEERDSSHSNNSVSSEDSNPPSPQASHRTASKSLTLPYFQLPNPDFDEYLAITDERLIGSRKDSLSSSSSLLGKISKNKILDDFLASFKKVESPKTSPLQNTNLKCNNEGASRNSNEYSDIISRIGKLDESKSPGIKRLALKGFLIKQINEKKSAAFNRSKEFANFNENEEIESEENNYSDVEEIRSMSESSEDDNEEQTVSFSNEDQEDNMGNVDSSDSDEDILVAQRKVKRPQILDEDSNDSGDLPVITDVIKDSRSNNLMTPKDLLSSTQSSDIPSYQPGGCIFIKGKEEMDDEDSNCAGSFMSEVDEQEKGNILNFTENNLSSSIPPFQLTMDDPPISLPANGSQISGVFLSQDLAAVCSGSFKSREENSESERHKQISDVLEDGVVEDDDKQLDGTFEDPPVNEKIKDYFDLEAELSGEDDGEDDPESDGEGLGDLIASDHDLPSNIELRDEIVDLHMKQLIDDDEEILREYKEKFLDDGELHTDGRARRFAWKNAAIDIDVTKDKDSSDSDDEVPADSWDNMNQEKVKWRDENKEKELQDDFNSSCKNSLKVKIIGKLPAFSHTDDFSKKYSFKRPRGSLLHLDNSSSSQVLKKLKASEDEGSGSRTTKHFVFRNELLSEDTNGITKEVSSSLTIENITVLNDYVDSESVFSKIQV